MAGITEVPPVALLPNFIVQRKVLKPFRFQTGGSILVSLEDACVSPSFPPTPVNCLIPFLALLTKTVIST